jgi:hypothetical protein
MSAQRRATHDAHTGDTRSDEGDVMLIDASERATEARVGDPPYDRAMLALQYITALVAAVAALLLGPIR